MQSLVAYAVAKLREEVRATGRSLDRYTDDQIVEMVAEFEVTYRALGLQSSAVPVVVGSVMAGELSEPTAA